MDLKKVLATIETRLVDDWRQAWKWLSVQILALFGLIELLRASFSDDLYGALPAPWGDRLRIALIIGTVLARVYRQKLGGAQ